MLVRESDLDGALVDAAGVGLEDDFGIFGIFAVGELEGPLMCGADEAVVFYAAVGH